MLGVPRPPAEKVADVGMGHLAARGGVRLVPDEHAPGISTEEPAIPVRAAVKLSCLDRHSVCPADQAALTRIKGRGPRAVPSAISRAPHHPTGE